MVDKLKEILVLIHQDKKDVSLFAMLKIDDITDRWSIIFSAPGLEDDTKRKETFTYLANLLLKNLNDKEIKSVARVGVFPHSNHLVENLLRFKAGYEIKESTQVNGNTVHEGYILESNELSSS